MTTKLRLPLASPGLRASAALLGLALTVSGCHRTAELPPENPQEAPDERAPLIPILTTPPSAESGLLVEGFETPESVLYDARADLYWVSNVHGSALAQDDNGFISQLSPAGTIITRAFVDGARPDVTLHAPKGLALSGETLFVTDISIVRGFDRSSGKATRQTEIEQASFLNDLVATADGTLYVSDSGFRLADGEVKPSGADAIYRVRPDGSVALLSKSPKLRHPDGLALVEDGIWVASHGSATLLKLDFEGKIVQEQELAAGRLDGIAIDGAGELLISSWDASAVFRGKPTGAFNPVLRDLHSPADIGFDSRRGRVLVPLFERGAVRIIPLPLASP